MKRGLAGDYWLIYSAAWERISRPPMELPSRAVESAPDFPPCTTRSIHVFLGAKRAQATYVVGPEDIFQIWDVEPDKGGQQDGKTRRKSDCKIISNRYALCAISRLTKTFHCKDLGTPTAKTKEKEKKKTKNQ